MVVVGDGGGGGDGRCRTRLSSARRLVSARDVGQFLSHRNLAQSAPGAAAPGREHCAPRARCERACVVGLLNVQGVHDTLAPVFDQEAASCRVRPGLIFSVVARRGREFLYTRAARGSLYLALLRFTWAVVAMRAPLQLDNVRAGARVGLRFYLGQVGTR